MSIFDAYDTEFSALRQEISKNISEYRECSEDRSTSLYKLVEALLLQSSDLIKQMEIEARSSDSSSRKILNEKVSQYKKTTAAMKNDFLQIKTQQDKNSLMNTSKGSEQRQRLLDTNDRLSRQNEMISNAHRSVSETEEVGLEITAELARNREKIESSRAKAAEYSGITDSARRLIGSMNRRDSRQKFTAIFIFVVLIVVVVLFVYYHN